MGGDVPANVSRDADAFDTNLRNGNGMDYWTTEQVRQSISVAGYQLNMRPVHKCYLSQIETIE